ncbi:RNA polymerase sigma factor [Falsibacillus pallidus]|uniref:RNA polymerase sigma (SigV) subunit n=1 Tax=Falsibacillus pallidus TaxID=493781 RepID=A0A370FYA9_9BACI|nr:RNA polymerase sigma factor [Falsibacillus pallidus]RDI36445.1 RNA polymerase sigma (SigV) subunit [Falsibacillus pallidus]
MSSKKLEQLLIDCIQENKESVYRLAFSYVKNQQDALDIVQESIRKSFTSVSALKNETVIKSWFFRIVVNTSLDFLRKNKRIQLVDDETMEMISPGTEDQYANLDLEKAMEELPNKYRVIVILRFFEDMKIEEISAVLNEKISTVKTRLYKALRLLKEQLSDEELEEVQ